MTVPVPDARRFASIEVGEATPLYFDPAAVIALEARGEDGGYALHLAGGQSIELRPAIAAAVLAWLGVADARPARKPKAKRRRARKPKSEAPAHAGKPLGLLAAVSAFFAG